MSHTKFAGGILLLMAAGFVQKLPIALPGGKVNLLLALLIVLLIENKNIFQNAVYIGASAVLLQSNTWTEKELLIVIGVSVLVCVARSAFARYGAIFVGAIITVATAGFLLVRVYPIWFELSYNLIAAFVFWGLLKEKRYGALSKN